MPRASAVSHGGGTVGGGGQHPALQRGPDPGAAYDDLVGRLELDPRFRSAIATTIPVPEDVQAPTYLNSWSDLGTPWTLAGYYLFDKVVHLTGVTHHAAGVAVGSVIFTLPVGYRPEADLIFSAPYVTAGLAYAHGVITVSSTGDVAYINGDPNGMSLNLISFRVL